MRFGGITRFKADQKPHHMVLVSALFTDSNRGGVIVKYRASLYVGRAVHFECDENSEFLYVADGINVRNRRRFDPTNECTIMITGNINDKEAELTVIDDDTGDLLLSAKDIIRFGFRCFGTGSVDVPTPSR